MSLAMSHIHVENGVVRPFVHKQLLDSLEPSELRDSIFLARRSDPKSLMHDEATAK